MVRKIVLSLIAVLGICAVAMAQNQQVSGTVTDAAGAPVATYQIPLSIELNSNPYINAADQNPL
ncbi:hypothetical protein F2Q38_10385 [Alistipes onderdonkii]|nr:hypothetical protein F2Q38_10385 [Alistipes onderdonkii]